MKNEIWRDIENFEGYYQVSNLGRIKSLNRYTNGRNSKRLIKGKILILFKDKDGYKQVNLYKNNKIKQHKVHRLVAQAFIPNSNNYPCINHKDEDKSNNCVDNLEWCTAKYNANYGTRNQRISKRVNQYDLDGNFIKTWDSIIQIEKKLNIYHSRILETCQGKRKQIGGYKWRYANE